MKTGQAIAVLVVVGGGILLLSRRAQAAGTVDMRFNPQTGRFEYLPSGSGLRPPTNPLGAIASAIGNILGRPRTVVAPGNAIRIPPSPAGVPAYVQGELPSALMAENLYGPLPPPTSAASQAAMLGLSTGASVGAGLLLSSSAPAAGIITTAPTATSAGVSSAAAGGGGVLGMGALAWTGIGAGAAALTWAIWKKGLFRGGEEALYVNPARDKYLLQFGPPSSAVPYGESGHYRLAAILTNLTKQENGGPLMDALNKADSKNEFLTATTNIDQLLAGAAMNGTLAEAVAGIAA